jgi:hypothetical protein
VVENKAVAQECIRYLRDQRVGTCVFLPLDNITVKPLPERLRSFGDRYKPCVNLLKCDEQYKVSVGSQRRAASVIIPLVTNTTALLTTFLMFLITCDFSSFSGYFHSYFREW